MARPRDLVVFRSLVIAPCLLACVVEEPLGPPGKNMTGPVTSGSAGSGNTDETGETGETGEAPGDTIGCDPLADPESECGPSMACDLTSRTCVPAPGDAGEDQPCATTQECAPGLVCAGDRCRTLCDVETGEGCSDERICAGALEPIPGLCLTSCELAFDDCTLPGEACKRVTGVGGQVYAACVSNPGAGLAGDACVSDPDCAPAHLCTVANLHSLPCANEAAACCTPVCDPLELPCFGLEPLCYVLGIPGQESAGFCGIE